MSWPLDSSHYEITSYPNTSWTWSFLGLNPGYECPPYDIRALDNSEEYWRDPTIPEAQDRTQASPGNNGLVGCYSAGPSISQDHEGTDIKADDGSESFPSGIYHQFIKVTTTDKD
jgi:hypothetical protein